jgi:hypothetical protein
MTSLFDLNNVARPANLTKSIDKLVIISDDDLQPIQDAMEKGEDYFDGLFWKSLV